MSNLLYKYNKNVSKVTPNGLGDSRRQRLVFIIAQVNVLYMAVSHSATLLWPGV